MKLGAEKRTKFALAALLLAGAVFLAVRTFSGGGPAIAASPTPAAAPATAQVAQPRPGTRRGRAASGREGQFVTSSLDPRLNLELLKTSESIEYEGHGRNIFRADAEPAIPKPVASAITPAKGPAPPPANSGPPPPPPIPLKFFGFASKPGEPTKVFLSQGEEVFVAAEGQIVDRRYKIVKITPTSVEVEDLLSNSRQTIPLTQG